MTISSAVALPRTPSWLRRAPAGPLRAAGRLIWVPLALIVTWYLMVAIFGSFAIAPPDLAVGQIVEGVHEGWLLPSLAITMATAVGAFLIASALGLAIATVMGLSRFWGAVIESPLVWLYSVPKITLYPIFLLTLKITIQSRVAFAVAHGFIPLALFTYSGMKSVTAVHRRVQRLYGLSWWVAMRQIYLPSAAPSVIVGLRYCFSLCMVGTVVAEMFAAYEGTGFIIIQAIHLHRIARLYGVAIVLALIALAVNGLFVAWEGWSHRWGGA